MPKYSIIIPAYNAEDRIRKVLDSVRCQEYKDYELIVICDSCTDNTESIAKKEYKAITRKVNFHNDGLSRSKGLDIAKGDWILFLDDDDWWLHEYVLSMIDEAICQLENGNTNVLQFGFIWKGKGYCPSRKNPNSKEQPMYANVWTKCIRRSFIGDTRFPEVHSTSDYEFMKLLNAKGINLAYLDQAIYYYNWLREGSISEIDSRK